jgi:hypothetical protein
MRTKFLGADHYYQQVEELKLKMKIIEQEILGDDGVR